LAIHLPRSLTIDLELFMQCPKLRFWIVIRSLFRKDRRQKNLPMKLQLRKKTVGQSGKINSKVSVVVRKTCIEN
jgi:hypothetical protein